MSDEHRAGGCRKAGLQYERPRLHSEYPVGRVKPVLEVVVRKDREPPPILFCGKSPTAMTRVTLYTRIDCCLCDQARAVIETVAHEHPLELEEVKIDGDEDLLRRYGELVPVVLLDGRPTYEFRVDERDLRERIASGTRATA